MIKSFTDRYVLRRRSFGSKGKNTRYEHTRLGFSLGISNKGTDQTMNARTALVISTENEVDCE